MIASTMKSQRGKGGGGIGPEETLVTAFHPTGGGAKGLSASEDMAPGTGTGAGGTVAVAFALRKDPGGTGQGHNTNYVASPLVSRSSRGNAQSNSPGFNADDVVSEAAGVRRLTPIECERLQGLPDGWTELDAKTPDSRRYSALGDAVTANVAEWIGLRLEAA